MILSLVSALNITGTGGRDGCFWFFPDPTTGYNCWKQIDSGTFYGGKPVIFFPVNVSSFGQSLTKISMSWKGGGGHTFLPQYRPSIMLYRIDNAGNKAFIVSATDNSPTILDYQNTSHNISATFSHTTVANWSYYIEIYGESGDNALIGGALYQVEVN